MLQLARVYLRAERGDEAEALLRRAHAHGSAVAAVELAAYLQASQRAAEGRALLLAAANDGDVHALQTLYRQARDDQEAGLPSDDPHDWLRRGADAGAPGAVVVLWSPHRLEGEDLSTFARCAVESRAEGGLGSAVDRLVALNRVEEAEHWLWLAVSNGLAKAHLRLAQLLEARGHTDLATEVRWRAVATDQSAAIKVIRSMVETGSAREDVERWLRHSLSAPESLTFMLQHTFEGAGRVDELESLLRGAVVDDIAGAALQLAVFLRGIGDIDGSRCWTRESAERGDVAGMREWSELLFRDGDAAGWEEWLRRAALAGDEGALLTLVFNLGRQGRRDEAARMYHYGLEPEGPTATVW